MKVKPPSCHLSVKPCNIMLAYLLTSYLFSWAYLGSYFPYAKLVLLLGIPGFQLPQLQYPEDISSDMLVLRKEDAWHIGGALSQSEAEEWKLLYHSAINGLSFNTFMGNIS